MTQKKIAKILGVHPITHVPMHVLILNYNALHTTFLKKALRYEGIGVDTCRPENIQAIWYGQYDAIIAALEEWTLQKYQEIKDLIGDLGNIPTLFTAKGLPPKAFEEEQIQNPRLAMAGTHLPFHHFLKTLRLLIHDNGDPEIENAILNIGDLHIDMESHEVKRDKTRIKLRHREFYLLACLMQNPNRVLTRTYLLETVWDRNVSMTSNTVDVHISRLRRKIDDPYAKKYTHTIPQAGYKLATR